MPKEDSVFIHTNVYVKAEKRVLKKRIQVKLVAFSRQRIEIGGRRTFPLTMYMSLSCLILFTSVEISPQRDSKISPFFFFAIKCNFKTEIAVRLKK